MGMNRPSLDDLMGRVDSRYTLVVVAAKRARQITEVSSPLDKPVDKPVTAALNEILAAKVGYETPSPGKKVVGS